MNPDGSGLRPLTSFDGYAPDFTANGKRVVFWRNDDPPGTNPEEDPEIFSIAVDGTGLRQLTDSGAGIAGDDIASSPSRDGLDRIAWVSRRDDDNNREIVRMKADGSGVVQLTFDAAGVENRGPD
jgi:Tol biopolymer transport system component